MDATERQNEALARGADSAPGSPGLLVMCELAGEEYGLLASRVREIIRHRPTSRVPHAAPYIEGVIDLRGRLVPVFSLHRRLALPAVPAERLKDLVVVVVESAGNLAGLLVDRVTDVVKINEADVEGAGKLKQMKAGAQFLAGAVAVAGRTVALLDLRTLLEGPETGSGA